LGICWVKIINMYYADYNLFEVLENSKNAKDMKLSRELILSELGKVIYSRPFDVKRVLRSCKIKISDTATKRKLVVVVTENLAANGCLRTGLAKLVIANQVALPKATTGFSNTSGNKVSGDAWVTAIGNAFGTAAGIWSTERQYDQQKDMLNQQMQIAKLNQDTIFAQMEHDQTMRDNALQYGAAAGANAGKGSKTMWILIGVAALTIVGVIIVSSRKKNKGKGKVETVEIAPTT